MHDVYAKFVGSADDVRVIDNLFRPLFGAMPFSAPDPEGALGQLLPSARQLTDDQLAAVLEAAKRGRTDNVRYSDINNAINAALAQTRTEAPTVAGGTIRITPDTHPVEWKAWMRWARQNKKRDAFATRLCSWETIGAADVKFLMPPSNDEEAA